jgi:phosphoribosyl 1,2-cyclic phosphodiesterase
VEAREVGGKSFRLRSHALINNELLIDLSPDLLTSSFVHGKPLHGLKYVVQTHPHPDHLDPFHFAMRTERFGITGLGEIGFWGTAASIQLVRDRLGISNAVREAEVLPRLKLSLNKIALGESFMVGPYRCTAVPADHDAPGVSALYAIEYGDHALFYGTDTGAMVDEAWEILISRGVAFDVVIFDHTFGVKDVNSAHMNSRMVLDAWNRLGELGLLREGARLIGTHIAPHSNPIHDRAAAIAAASGYEIAYDGMVVSIG